MSEHLVERLTASGEWTVEDLPWPDDVDRFRWLDGHGFELVLEIGDTDPPGLGLAIRGYRRRTGDGAGQWLVEVDDIRDTVEFLVDTGHQALDLIARWSPAVTAEMLHRLRREDQPSGQPTRVRLESQD